MGFSLGGIVKGIAKVAGKTILNATPLGQAVDAVKTLGGIVKDHPSMTKPIAGGVLNAGPRISVPGVTSSSGDEWVSAAGIPASQNPNVKDGSSDGNWIQRKYLPKGGSMVPQLPKLTGGFGDVSAGSSSTAPTHRASFGRKRRRMNPMNAKALRRAARRLESGEKLFRKVFTMIHHKPAGKVVPKRRKRA